MAILRFFVWYFCPIFPWARGKIFKSISTNQKFTPDKKENFSWLLKHLNQRKNTSPLTNFHFYHFQPYLVQSAYCRVRVHLFPHYLYIIVERCHVPSHSSCKEADGQESEVLLCRSASQPIHIMTYCAALPNWFHLVPLWQNVIGLLLMREFWEDLNEGAPGGKVTHNYYWQVFFQPAAAHNWDISTGCWEKKKGN